MGLATGLATFPASRTFPIPPAQPRLIENLAGSDTPSSPASFQSRWKVIARIMGTAVAGEGAGKCSSSQGTWVALQVEPHLAFSIYNACLYRLS